MANPTGTDGTKRWQWVQILFGTTPAAVTTANPLPVTVVAGTNDAVTIADGADVAEGAVADAAVAAGAAGTLSAKLRRLTTDIGALIALAVTEDAAAASDPVGFPWIVRRRDTMTAAEVSADGDNIAVNATSKGQVRTATELRDSSDTALVFSTSTLTTGQNALSTSNEVVLAANSARLFAEVKNDDAAIKVFLGKDATVSASNGHALKPGEAFDFEGYTGAIWAIAASGTPNVTFIEW